MICWFVRLWSLRALRVSTDQDEVRLGTLPLGFSEVAAGRLDKEMKRLSYRFGVEARVLAKQAQKLSPEAHGS